MRFVRHKRKRKGKIIAIAVSSAAVLLIGAFCVLCIRFLNSAPENIESAEVPNICGMELSKAEKAMEQNGLSLKVIGSGASIGEEYTIAWQSADKGEALPGNSVVEVWVNRPSGDRWRWTQAERTFEILSVSDINYTVEYVSDALAGNNIVTDVAISGSDAVVYVNKPQPIEMPDLSGLTEAQAAEKLGELGIAYVKSTAADTKIKEGKILEQQPKAGENVYAGEITEITICSGIVESPVFDIKAEGKAVRELTVGQRTELSVSVSPDAASLSKLSWTSSDTGVAAVEAGGYVKAVGAGSAVITVESEDGEHSAQFTVNVNDKIMGMEIKTFPETKWLAGDEFLAEGLSVMAYTMGGKSIDITDKCTVNAESLKEEGTTTVTVSCNEDGSTMSECFDISYAVASLEINAESVILGKQDRHSLHAEFSPEYAKVTYKSSDESIAVVSEDGVITGIKPGKCTITAEIEGKIQRKCNVTVKRKVVYLTFDDGPNTYTDEILGCLDKHGIKATFFCIGNSRYKKIYKRIAEEGHSIGLHTYSHTYSKCYVTVDAFMNESYKLQNLIYECAGVKPMIVRFPGGTSNTVAERDVMLGIVERLEKEGFEYYDWNSSSNDTIKGITAEEVAKRVLNTCYDDTEIVLMHNYPFTCDAIDIIVPALRRRGYNFKVITTDTPPIHSEIRGKGH